MKSLRKCGIQVQRTSYKSFTPCLHASTVYFRNCLATVRMIFPPSATIHTNGDVNAWITGRWRLGVRGVVAVRIPRVLSVRLHNNWHIRAMVRNEIGSGVRHSAIRKVRRIILVGRGERVTLTVVLLSRMRRRGWLHRHVVSRVRRGLSRLVHPWDGRVLSIDRKRVTHWAHERRSRRRVATRGYPGKHGWRGSRVRLAFGC